MNYVKPIELNIGDVVEDDKWPNMTVSSIEYKNGEFFVTFINCDPNDNKVTYTGETLVSVKRRSPGLTSPISPLPTDSKARKDVPLWTGVVQYVPAALAAAAKTSAKGNAKHNPGQPLHHARGKSMDHQDCAARHMTDFDAMMAYRRRFGEDSVSLEALEEELGNYVWRANMWAQEQLEALGLAPRAPRAVLPGENAEEVLP